METALVPMSEPMCKTLVPINGKPVLQYILDELYSYQGYIDEVVIVKRDAEDIREYIKYNKQDDFFLTKVHCIDGSKYKQPLNPKYDFLDDFYSGMEYLVDEVKVCPSEVLLWSADELIFNSERFADLTTGSFVCSHNMNKVGVYRFDKFVHIVNTLVYLKNDTIPHTIEDFLELYNRHDSVNILKDFGDYRVWNNKIDYYKLQTELIKNNQYSSVFLDIDLIKEQITKTNKYMDEPYSYSINELSREVQYNLWSEANFLDIATPEQAIFLPRLIDQGVNKRGEYCDYVVEEFITGTTLDSLILNEKVADKDWKFILSKIVSTIQDTFHMNDLEDSDELYHSYVPKKRRDAHVDEYRERINDVLSSLSSTFNQSMKYENAYFMTNNEVIEWRMFFDRFFDEYKKRCGRDNLIYNGTCERLVHNNLLLENIVYDTFTNRMVFINPRSKKLDIVNKNKDYATLYLSCYGGLDALMHGRYTSTDTEITISYPVQQQMDYCLSVLDDLFEDNEFLRMYAIALMFEMAHSNKLSTDKKVALLRYASQLKLSLIKNRIFN
jgi:hypothetical protein